MAALLLLAEHYCTRQSEPGVIVLDGSIVEGGMVIELMYDENFKIKDIRRLVYNRTGRRVTMLFAMDYIGVWGECRVFGVSRGDVHSSSSVG